MVVNVIISMIKIVGEKLYIDMMNYLYKEQDKWMN
jgi:hypothetical protein